MQIELRKANIEDSQFLFDLRNDPSAHKWFKNPNPVAEEEHQVWLLSVLKEDSSKHLFIIENENQRAGQLRIDKLNEKQAEIHISLAKEHRGKGLGTLALKEGILLAKELGFKELEAEVHQDNLASQGLFQKLGFVFQEQKDIWKTFILKL